MWLRPWNSQLKFIYSEKATKFYEIFPLLLTTFHTVKSKGKILQNLVAFSEYMNFNSYVFDNIVSENVENNLVLLSFLGMYICWRKECFVWYKIVLHTYKNTVQLESEECLCNLLRNCKLTLSINQDGWCRWWWGQFLFEVAITISFLSFPGY